MHCMTRFAGRVHGDRPFDPNVMQKRVDRLKREGKLPSPEQFLKVLQEAILEEKAQRKT